MAKRPETFADRLNKACDRHPDVPESHGRQAWVKRGLEGLGESVTAQGVSNWFADRSTPRSKPLKALSKLLNVSEAGLLGYEQSENATEEVASERERELTVDGPETHDVPIRIRPGVSVVLKGLPIDIAESEAKRLANVILALAN